VSRLSVRYPTQTITTLRSLVRLALPRLGREAD